MTSQVLTYSLQAIPLLPEAEPVALPDSLLIARTQQGDPESFRLLIVRYQRPVFALLRRMGFDGDTADDLAQESFISAWRALARFRGDSRFSTWLYRIVYRQGLQYLRHRTRQRRLTDTAAAQPTPAAPDTASQAELRVVLDVALAQLPPPQRMALALYYFQEQSYEEVAAIMECPLNTVRTHIHRGKQRLRQLLPAEVTA